MLIDLTSVWNELYVASLISLQEAANIHEVSDERFAEVQKLVKTIKDITIQLGEIPHIVVEIEGNEYFTMVTPR